MNPDSAKHNPDPVYLRSLIARAGISQREAARRIGISDRLMRMYLADRSAATAQDAPYAVQFALENLPADWCEATSKAGGVARVKTGH